MNALFFYQTKAILWVPCVLSLKVPSRIPITIPRGTRTKVRMGGLAFDGCLILDLIDGANVVNWPLHIPLPHDGDINLVEDLDRLNNGYQPFDIIATALSSVKTD